MNNPKQEAERLLAKYQKRGHKYGMEVRIPLNGIVSDLRKLVDSFNEPPELTICPDCDGTNIKDINNYHICDCGFTW